MLKGWHTSSLGPEQAKEPAHDQQPAERGSLRHSVGDEQLTANWYSSCFPLAQLVPGRMFVLCYCS